MGKMYYALRGAMAGFLLALGSLGIMDSWSTDAPLLAYYTVLTGIVLCNEVMFIVKDYKKTMRDLCAAGCSARSIAEDAK